VYFRVRTTVTVQIRRIHRLLLNIECRRRRKTKNEIGSRTIKSPTPNLFRIDNIYTIFPLNASFTIVTVFRTRIYFNYFFSEDCSNSSRFRYGCCRAAVGIYAMAGTIYIATTEYVRFPRKHYVEKFTHAIIFYWIQMEYIRTIFIGLKRVNRRKNRRLKYS